MITKQGESNLKLTIYLIVFQVLICQVFSNNQSNETLKIEDSIPLQAISFNTDQPLMVKVFNITPNHTFHRHLSHFIIRTSELPASLFNLIQPICANSSSDCVETQSWENSTAIRVSFQLSEGTYGFELKSHDIEILTFDQPDNQSLKVTVSNQPHIEIFDPKVVRASRRKEILEIHGFKLDYLYNVTIQGSFKDFKTLAFPCRVNSTRKLRCRIPGVKGFPLHYKPSHRFTMHFSSHGTVVSSMEISLEYELDVKLIRWKPLNKFVTLEFNRSLENCPSSRMRITFFNQAEGRSAICSRIAVKGLNIQCRTEENIVAHDKTGYKVVLCHGITIQRFSTTQDRFSIIFFMLGLSLAGFVIFVFVLFRDPTRRGRVSKNFRSFSTRNFTLRYGGRERSKTFPYLLTKTFRTTTNVKKARPTDTIDKLDSN